jgi:two-component system response regulator (stage 0 sporulation protein A)
MSKLVSDYLLYLGFSPVRSGYRYLNAILDMLLHGERVYPLNKYGYITVGRKYNKTPEVIDKNIQNSIANVWLKGNTMRLEKEFGETIDPLKGKPTNKQFIATVMEKLLFLSS